MYQRTAVVTIRKAGGITLDSGGSRAVATLAAMNQAAAQYGLGFKVTQRRRRWYVEHGGCELEFRDGMVLGGGQ